MSTMIKIDFEKELNSAQHEVVTAGDGPHLVLAGAGSGKTRTLTYRVAWLLEQGIKPERILLLTFTNKAAAEMMERVKNLIGLQKDNKLSLWGGTFHSVGNRLLRIYGKHIGVEPGFAILDQEDKKTLLKNISKELFGNLPDKSKPSPAIISEVISFAINSGIKVEESLDAKFPEWLPIVEFFEKVLAEYKKRKQANSLLDFDDLLSFWKTLTEHPKIGPILDAKWDYILVDEYQDTNTVQAEIVYNLAESHQNILAVGDDAQSIYSFRAADIRNILDFPKKFKNAKTHKLETNYRSTPEILNLANNVISKNKKQFTKKLSAVLPSYTRPELSAVRNNIEEAIMITDRIQGLMADGLRPKQIAILFRAAHHSQSLEMELNKRGIDYEMRGGLKFFERAHIKDVAAWLRILYNHKDAISWQRVLQLYEGVGPATAKKIITETSQIKTLEELPGVKPKLSEKATQSWNKVNEVLSSLFHQKQKNIGELIKAVNEKYRDYLIEKFPDHYQREDDLGQLAAFASSYDDLGSFLTEVSLQENFTVRQAQKQDNDVVVLSTVHQSKGLEWPAVFIMNLTTQSFPHPLAVTEHEQEEERRLLYVAITRAMKHLYLTYPMSVYRFDGHKSMQPSIFISDIDGNLLNHNELSRNITYASGDGVSYESDGDFEDHEKNERSDGFLPDVDNW
ncbi:ATP-dependent helicase [Candidatus Parcubacteria bacterium]|nr:ATP-dependent helicase [Candidatus Parcubacteria bacterium]